MIPNPTKQNKQGEDAYFIASDGKSFGKHLLLQGHSTLLNAAQSGSCFGPLSNGDQASQPDPSLALACCWSSEVIRLCASSNFCC